MSLFDRIANIFRPQLDPEPTIAPARRYVRLWRFAVSITSVIAIVPLAFMTLVNYYQDQRAYRAEMSHQISLILNTTKNTLEFIIEERQSVLSLLVRQKDFFELSNDDSLRATLINLKNSFGGFVDLGIIDSDGIQRYYTGPYDLKGKNYRDQPWFHEVCLRGVHVSDVFMGYRNFPHFIIAIKRDIADGNFFILRATVDMELINNQIYALDLDKSTDVFIINKDGILQTDSKFMGKELEDSGIRIPLHSRNKINILESRSKAKRISYGYAFINNSPFIIYASTQLENPFKHWISRRAELLWFLGVTIIVIVVIIIYRSTYMVNRLRTSDERRAKALHNIEYTNKMATIGRMAASVAHEINNPLAIINEKAGLLKDIVSHTEDFPRKDKSYSLLTAIEDSVERCSKVTHRLLGFSRRMEVKKEVIDVENLMVEVAGFLGKEAEHRNITINFDFGDNLPTLESDRGQLQQVFLNILNNAVAAVPDGGRINIKAAQINEGFVDITISDNGSGILPENLKNIFEPFFSTKGEFGTGLGLSITKDIVEKLAGKINVNSEVGVGTDFTVSLPVRKQAI